MASPKAAVAPTEAVGAAPRDCCGIARACETQRLLKGKGREGYLCWGCGAGSYTIDGAVTTVAAVPAATMAAAAVGSAGPRHLLFLLVCGLRSCGCSGSHHGGSVRSLNWLTPPSSLFMVLGYLELS